MKILLVAMNSIHFVRWTNQLEDSGHQVYWFDILDMGYSENLQWVNQIIGWKKKHPNKRGRYFIKRRLPYFHKLLKPFFYNSTEQIFENKLKEVKPDIVHSFAMQVSCLPILSVMQKYTNQKWVYSSWGSDLYYPESVNLKSEQVESILKRVDYFISDCFRDFKIAENYGFKGKYLGCIPGGGGYNIKSIRKYIISPASKRNLILIKGYQDGFGQSIAVLAALKNIKNLLVKFEIIVFSADIEVIEYVENEGLKDIFNLKVLPKTTFLEHNLILELMGKSLIFIGNSVSDGLPNTLIEAVIMGAFPIQSNPGGASAEIIKNNRNGLLIEKPKSVGHIKTLIEKAILNPQLIEEAFHINQNEIKSKFDIEKITKEVLSLYIDLEKSIN